MLVLQFLLTITSLYSTCGAAFDFGRREKCIFYIYNCTIGCSVKKLITDRKNVEHDKCTEKNWESRKEARKFNSPDTHTHAHTHIHSVSLTHFTNMAAPRECAVSPPLGDIHHNPCVESLGDIISSQQARLGGSSMAPNRLHEDWKIFAVICAGGFISRDLILLELMGTPVRVINSNSKGGSLEDRGGKRGVGCITARVIVRGEVVTGPVV